MQDLLAFGDGDRCHKEPPYPGRYEDADQGLYIGGGRRREDYRGGRQNGVHENGHEQAPRAVVYPHHQHPIGR